MKKYCVNKLNITERRAGEKNSRKLPAEIYTMFPACILYQMSSLNI